MFPTRDLVVRQRTQLINAIRGHLTEYGWVAPRGTAHMTLPADMLDDEEIASTLPAAALPLFRLMVDLLAELDKRIATLDREIARRAKEDEAARRLMTIPGIGPIAATAMLARKPRMQRRRGRRRIEGGYGTTVGETGPEEPVTGRAPSRRAKLIWIRSANSHTGPQLWRCSSRPEQMTATDYGPTCPDLPLASEGAFTEVRQQSVGSG
ncbi:transposase [Sphingomonas psychrotolerans]|uniref:transposase n=1 Tax=Sphingomonas psychrotolerans TaxID=1327635 RepID=UPI0018F328A6|nr:transposase [Sphingomonas psychrotolerans]